MIKHNNSVEIALGAMASCGGALFTNPFEVVKTRMQLQGELKSRGQYSVHYRNVFHAIYTIAKTDGILALQNGLSSALWYQIFMNGSRLGSFQIQENLGLTKDRNGNHSFSRSVAAGALSGCIGGALGSPFYLVKTHLQAHSTNEIAVGHQHNHKSMSHAFRSICKEFGVMGIWRGVTSSIPRVAIGSAAQLSTFSKSRDLIENTGIFRPSSWVTTFIASMVGGVTITFFMTPFDVVSTRLYNQPVTASNKGTLYSGVCDCFWQIFRSEGIMGLYKGWVPAYIRSGSQSTIGLVLLDQLRKGYDKYRQTQQN